MNKESEDFFASEREKFIKALVGCELFAIDDDEDSYIQISRQNKTAEPANLLICMLFDQYEEAAKHSILPIKQMKTFRLNARSKDLSTLSDYSSVFVWKEEQFKFVESVSELLTHSKDGVVKINLMCRLYQNISSKSGIMSDLKDDDPLFVNHNIRNFYDYMSFVFPKPDDIEEDVEDVSVEKHAYIIFNVNDYLDNSDFLKKMIRFSELKEKYDLFSSSFIENITCYANTNELCNFKILESKMKIEDLKEKCNDIINQINELNNIIERERVAASNELSSMKEKLFEENNFPIKEYSLLSILFS